MLTTTTPTPAPIPALSYPFESTATRTARLTESALTASIAAISIALSAAIFYLG